MLRLTKRPLAFFAGAGLLSLLASSPVQSASFSGTLRDGYGVPVDNVTIRFEAFGVSVPDGVTDGLGHFQLEVPVTTGTLRVFDSGPQANPVRIPPGWGLSTPITLSGSTVQDLTLPEAVNLTVRVIQADGSPVPGAWVTDSGDSVPPFELFPGSQVTGVSGSAGECDSLGIARLTCFRGAKILRLRATYQPIPGVYLDGSNENVTLFNDTTVTVVVPGVLATPIKPATPGALSLSFANPTKGPVAIQYFVPRESAVRLCVFDVEGRLRTVLASGSHRAGSHTCAWNLAARSAFLSAGVYIVSLEQDADRVTRLLAVLR